MAQNLIAVAETAQDVASGLNKFLDAAAEHSAEIAELIAECFRISSALRKLDFAQEAYAGTREHARINGDINLVRQSLTYTFRDILRLFGGLGPSTVIPGSAYRRVWGEISVNFYRESGNTLSRRLQWYYIFLQELESILVNGSDIVPSLVTVNN